MAEKLNPLFLHLHLNKIPPSTSEKTLDQVLQTLWRTRRTGIGSTHKPEIQSLLSLPSLEDLDPVIACLRMVIRKCVNEKLNRDDIRDLFPSDISVEFRDVSVMLLLKYQNQWKEEASRDQPLQQFTRAPQSVNAPSAYMLPPTSDLSPSLWPQQDDTNLNNNNLGGPVAGYVDPRLPQMAPLTRHEDNDSSDNMAFIPRLKSMTWTMENRNLMPANRVALITLKLQDYTKSPSGEIEVKFQLSKDTLEAMLRSMTYISEQLSNSVFVYFNKHRSARMPIHAHVHKCGVTIRTITEETEAIVAAMSYLTWIVILMS